MSKLAALAFCLVASCTRSAFAESPSSGHAVALAQPTSRVLRLNWWNLRSIVPDTYSVYPALRTPHAAPLLSARLLGNVVVVSGTTVLLVDEETPNAARWGLGCTMSGCTASARGSF
jgi:hypothetical protein